jgi:DNA-binding NarL/FixJ family response regulator
LSRLPSFRAYESRIEEIRSEIIDSDLLFWFQGDLGTIHLLFTLFGTKSDRPRFFCASLDELDASLRQSRSPSSLILSTSIGFANVDLAIELASRLSPNCRTLLIAKTIRAAAAKHYVDSGIDGLILEKSIIRQSGALLDYFKAVNLSETFVDPAIELGHSLPLALRRDELTDREFAVLLKLEEGSTNHEISVSLGCSIYTARDHVNVIIRKFGVANRTAAVVHAIRNEIL